MRRTDREDERWMAACLRLAEKGSGYVSPNPMVGAVLVVRGKAVAKGYHRMYGHPHAEVECLARYNGQAEHTTLYVNLEPCSHSGKTPPCADAIIRARIPRVVIGMKDPNPLVSGRGIRRLRKAGISVKIGVLEEQCRDLNRAFSRHIVSHLPYVHVKVARSIDGKIGGGWISSRASRKLVHEWRAGCDAVLVGAGTVRIDDPLLNVRFVRGRSPDVVILDGRLRVSPTSRLFEMRRERQVILCTTRRAVERNRTTFAELKALGVRVLIFRTSSRTIPLRAVCRRLYRLGIGSLLVEGGADVFGRFVSAGLIDRLSMFTAPEVRGRGVHAFGSPGPLLRHRTRALERTSVQSVGRDVLVDYVFSPEG